ARNHTQLMLPAFGAEVDHHLADTALDPAISVTGPVTLRSTSLRVPGDFSAAAFFLVAAAASPGASVTAETVSLNPTRVGWLEMLRRMGAGVSVQKTSAEAGEPIGNVTVTGPETLQPLDQVEPRIWEASIPTMIDEIPALAIAAARARGVTHITGAAELRVKETDRITTLA